MARTALDLIREIGERQQETIIVHPGASGQTSMSIPELVQWFPMDVNMFNGWVYASAPNTAQNQGVERRAQSWLAGGQTLTLYPPGFPASVTGGEYEIHMRYPRKRIMAALNMAVGQLALTWYRKTVDETLQTKVNTWIYYPSPLQNWSNIYRLEIQINTSPEQVGYPFADADYLNWRPRRWVDTTGNETWAIEFSILPPPGRQLRIFGESYFPQLVNDTDVLAIGGKWEQMAYDWIMDYSEFRLQWWLSNKQPTGEADRIRQQAMDRLEEQKNFILQNAPAHEPGRIVTPGHGDAMAFPSPEDWRYLGAFKSSSFTRTG